VNKQELINRTQSYALRVIKVVQALPNDDVSSMLGKQLLRSGTSVGANYRAACRAKSAADFLNKLKIVEEECDESIYWMELFVAAGSLSRRRLESLLKGSDEILSIVVSAIKTTRITRLS